MKAKLIWSFVVLLTICGCKSDRHETATIVPLAYRQAGEGQIAINITGEVKTPGKYLVKPPVTLADVLRIVTESGGWRRRNDYPDTLPNTVVIFRNASGMREQTKYSFFKMSQGELETIHIQDGDVVQFVPLTL